MVNTLILLQTILCVLAHPVSGSFNIPLAKSSRLADPPAETSPVPERHKGIKTTSIDKVNYEVKTVVIDAGHGGHDPGCLGGNSREKHLALAIALKLRDAMRQAYPDVRIIMTRDKDEFIPLYKRAAIANRAEADLFLSIHCNFIPGSAATRGSETYVMGLHTAEHNLLVAKRENAAILLEDDYEKNYDYDPNTPEGHIMLSMFQNAYLEQSILFAEAIERQLKDRARRRSRGVKQAGFVVLKETTMPSVLIETGFLSNAAEEKFLMGAEGQSLISGAILDAFTEYKTKIESAEYQQMTVSLKQPPPEPTTAAEQPNRQASASPADSSTSTAQVDNPGPNQDTPARPQAVYTNVYQKSETSETIDHRRLRAQGPVPRPSGTVAATTATPKNGTATEPSGTSRSEQIQFFVQLVASGRPQNTTEEKWQNLPYVIEVVQEDGLFKYRARSFKNLEEAVAAKQYLRQHGFPQAFVVPLLDGRRITVEKARTLIDMN